MMKIKAALYSIYDYIYRKLENVAEQAPQMNRVQPELARVPESVLEQSEATKARETFD